MEKERRNSLIAPDLASNKTEKTVTMKIAQQHKPLSKIVPSTNRQSMPEMYSHASKDGE